jgi:DNA-binding HxlR family transcriptional regulator
VTENGEDMCTTFSLQIASENAYDACVGRRSKSSSRSGCPVSTALELIGDRWSLLIVRDMMVRGYRTFREFQRAGEGIATNILADRLQKLEAGGIVVREAAANDGRSLEYRLTEKGIALGPVLLELLIWGAHHEESDAHCAAIETIERNRASVIAEAYRRWEQRDPTPLIPPFTQTAKPKPKSNSPKGRFNR